MKNKKKLLAGILATMSIILLCFGLRFTYLLDAQQQNLSTQLYKPRELSEELVIVAIDEKSLSSVSQGGLGGFNQWSWKYYAEVLSQVESGKPTTVFFDILFSSEQSGIREKDLFEMVEANPDVQTFATQILAFLKTPHPYEAAFAEALSQYDNVYLSKNYLGEATWNGSSFDILDEDRAIDSIHDASKSGFASVVDSEDGENSSIIFAIPTLLKLNGVEEKHIDLQLTEEHLDTSLQPVTEKGQMLINYAAPSYSYPMVSFSDVYYGRVDPSEFEGKMVLIGATASVLQDRQFTPIDQDTPMPGIEIHANAIQTMLDEAYLQYQSTAGFLVLVGLIALISTFVFLFAPVLVAAGFLVLEIVAFPFYAQWSFNHGIIPDLIWPVFAMVVSYVAVLVYRNITEFAEKRKLKMAFSRYVSPELAEEITEKPDMLKLGGDRKNITALFLDIENFTTLSEGLEPQEVVRVINVYFDALALVIMGHGGSVDKYEGDAIMALFGAPVPSTDHAVKACFAAMAIQARMKELNAQMGYNLNIRIGLATGDAIVGNMGSSQRFDYTAMGDTVNTASRLEGANKFYKTGILVNPGTFEAAQSQIFFRKVDTVCLKGKENAIGIYQVLGTQEGATPDGKAVVAEWQSALEDYKAANWDDAEKKIRSVLTKMPEDGPAKTFLGRIAELRTDRDAGLRPGWDGVWRFESK